MAIEKIRHVSGTALPLRGDSIDTDRIIPARFLRSVSFEGLEQHLFEDDRTQADASAPGHPSDLESRLRRKLDAAGEREFRLRLVARARAAGNPPAGHSRRRGRVVFGNLLRQLRRIGLPCVTASHADMDRLQALVETDADDNAVAGSRERDCLRWWRDRRRQPPGRRAGVVPRRHMGRHRHAARSIRGRGGGGQPFAVRDGLAVKRGEQTRRAPVFRPRRVGRA